MNEKDTGGPAFPVAFTTTPLTGMTLRDWFAGLAMQGRLAVPGGVDCKYDAEFAYKMADAMLQERAQ